MSDAVASLTAGGAPPRWVVIDDGWQQTEVDAPFRQDPTRNLPLPKPREASLQQQQQQQQQPPAAACSLARPLAQGGAHRSGASWGQLSA